MFNHTMRPGLSLLFLIGLMSCKPAAVQPASNTSSAASAPPASSSDANKEVSLTANSFPEPVASPKLQPEDLDPARTALSDAFPRAEIAARQKAGSALTGTPPELQGIWWMDGNPISDETVSFATVDFSQEKPLLAVFGANNFSFHAGADPKSRDTRQGNFAFWLAGKFNLVYEFYFNGNPSKYDQAKIIPTVRLKVGPMTRRLRISEQLLGFTMTKRGPHLYSRDNTVRGEPADGYMLRRILVPSVTDPNVLEKTEWWDMYAQQPVPTHLRLPQRH